MCVYIATAGRAEGLVCKGSRLAVLKRAIDQQLHPKGSDLFLVSPSTTEPTVREPVECSC